MLLIFQKGIKQMVTAVIFDRGSILHYLHMKHKRKMQSSICPKQVKTRNNLLLRDLYGSVFSFVYGFRATSLYRIQMM